MDVYEQAELLHKRSKGKLEVNLKVDLNSKEDLSLAYTPGVARPCQLIAENKEKAYDYTWKSNSVAVISDGSAVLGLGNIGPEAAMPVMEGKSILFKKFAGIDAIPLCLDTQDRYCSDCSFNQCFKGCSKEAGRYYGGCERNWGSGKLNYKNVIGIWG